MTEEHGNSPGTESVGGGMTGASPTSSGPPPPQRTFTSRVGRFVRTLAIPFRFLMKPFVFRVSEDGNKVTFTSYSALIYTWVLIPLGIATHLLNGLGWMSPVTLGWIQVTSILLLFLLLGDDMGLWALVVLGMVAALLGFAAQFIKQEWEVPILGWLKSLLEGLHVEYSPGLGLALAFFAFVAISFYVLPKAWFVGRYEITTREVTHIKRGVAVESWRRAGRDVKQRWPDVLEMIFGLGSGGVYLLDRQHKAVMSVPHVICLWFYRREVERVLEKIATTDYDDEEADLDDFD